MYLCGRKDRELGRRHGNKSKLLLLIASTDLASEIVRMHA